MTVCTDVVYNIQKASQLIFNTAALRRSGGFLPFDCATQTQSLKKMRKHVKPGADVLSMGIEPVLPSLLCDAKRVVMADPSYSSFIQIAIIIAAITALESDGEYNQFINDVFKTPLAIKDIRNYPKVMSKMSEKHPNISKAFYTLTDLPGQSVFSNYTFENYTLSQDDFYKLKYKIGTPLQFIWSDIMSLIAELGDEKFDFINYYASFNCLKYELRKKLLKETEAHINKGGTLFLVTENTYSDHYNYLTPKDDPRTWGNRHLTSYAQIKAMEKLLYLCSNIFDTNFYDLRSLPYKDTLFGQVLVSNYRQKTY